MGQVTEAFLTGLSERGDEPPLRKITGTYRIDLRDNGKVDHWYLTFDGGKVSVKNSSKNGAKSRADCHMITDSELFDRMAGGRANAMAAVLRGAILVRGDLDKVVAFQRLFPGPPSHTARGRKQ
ncbi:MAG TPA: SCP2 sterol-binding domain-containing protein [Candidatus Limnocylindrales bacterium]|nr:SCP2 sterol-binding domain-containing protein [Candidatus Limnocylindrales bacterium]